MRLADHAPHSGIQHTRVSGLHHDLAASGLLIHEQRTLPGLSSIGGFIDTAFGVGTKQVPHYCQPNDIRIFRMDDDADDMATILQSQIAPGFSSIITAPNTAQSLTHISPHRTFTFPCIQDALIGRGYGYCPNAATKELIADILPIAATVNGFPDPPTHTSKI